MAAHEYFYALGRRKAATARVRVQGGKGVITVNGKPALEYFAGSEYLLAELQKPFVALEKENKYDVSVKVMGGGPAGQTEAVRLGVSRALVLINADWTSALPW